MIFLSLGTNGQDTTAVPGSTNLAGKEVLISERISRVPEGNDFSNPDSEFCFQRSKATENFVLFGRRNMALIP